jgi:hypothetical protein
VSELESDKEKRRRVRRNLALVRKLLWEEWDPIGVNVDGSGAEDEYNRYADRAYAMLIYEGRSEKEIADYLYFASTELMGLRASQRLRELAD